jgi:phosphoglycolate phosphatase
MKLIIFDLDQTLVNFIAVHDEVMRKLFKKFFGVDARLTEMEFAGKSLTDNFRDLARLKNVPEEVFQKKRLRLLEDYETVFNEKIPKDGSKYVLPGAKELLKALSKTEHFVVLYTGSSRGVVQSVFRVTHLGKYFKLLFYGTEVKTRANMVRLAIEQAEKLNGQPFRDKDVVIIGDSLRDIECAKVFNAMMISVGTGFDSRKQLAAAKPDYLMPSLRDQRQILRIIG